MPIKRHGPGRDPTFQEWAGGLTWVAHPDEAMRRASHAIAVGPDGGLADPDAEAADLWLVEPVDASGLDERLAALGEVTGVVVLSGYHRRHAAELARRHDVRVHLPAPLAELHGTLDAPVEVIDDRLPGTAFEVLRVKSWVIWREAALYHERSGTLVVAESLVSQDAATGPGERLAVLPYARLLPPRRAFAGLDVERVLLGHGDPVLDDAQAVLDRALGNSYRGLPAYVAANPGYFLRAWYVAWRT